MIKQKNSYHMNIGGASVLLVLVVFALTVFAVLTLRASFHEMKMAEKAGESVGAYYMADTQAEEAYMAICEIFATSHIITSDGNLNKALLLENLNEYELLPDAELVENPNTLTYRVKTDYNMVLEVKLQLPNTSTQDISIHSWKLVSVEEGKYDSGMEEIWDGLLD